MARKTVNPTFGWLSTAASQSPTTLNGPTGMAALHNLAVRCARASTACIKNVPGRFPNGKTPKRINAK